RVALGRIAVGRRYLRRHQLARRGRHGAERQRRRQCLGSPADFMAENGSADRDRHQSVILVFGHDALVMKWVKKRTPWVADFGPSRAIGLYRDGKALGGVVYYN